MTRMPCSVAPTGFSPDASTPLRRRCRACSIAIHRLLVRQPRSARRCVRRFVPLPGAIDQDQFANAGVLSQVNAALRIPQAEFTPDRLAAEISAFAAEPARLTAMAVSARTVGRLDAAERLADLVAKVAGI